MSNSFTPASMNFQERPQVCHPPPKDPPPDPTSYPTSVTVTVDIAATPGIVPIVITESRIVAESATPGTYSWAGTTPDGSPYTATASLAIAPDDSGIIIIVTVDEEGTPTDYTYVCLLPSWGETSPETLGPEEFSGPAIEPDSLGEIQIGEV